MLILCQHCEGTLLKVFATLRPVDCSVSYLICLAVVHHVSLRQQHELIQLLVQPAAGLVDGGGYGTTTRCKILQAAAGSAWQQQDRHGSSEDKLDEHYALACTCRMAFNMHSGLMQLLRNRLVPMHGRCCDKEACSDQLTCRSVSRCIAVVLSSPLVGSSSRMIAGLMSSSLPMDTRLRSPPLIPLRKKPPAVHNSRASQLGAGTTHA